MIAKSVKRGAEKRKIWLNGKIIRIYELRIKKFFLFLPQNQLIQTKNRTKA
jgi:hypothetical protein